MISRLFFKSVLRVNECMQLVIRICNYFLSCAALSTFLERSRIFNYECGNNHVARSKVSRTEMLQWPGYKLPNSGVHDLGLAPRVWLITDCNHCEVTLILQRSPIICDWANVSFLRYTIRIHVKYSRYLRLYKRASQKPNLFFFNTSLDFGIMIDS